MLNASQITAHALTLPHFITKEYKFGEGWGGVVVQRTNPGTGKTEENYRESRTFFARHSLGRQVGGRGRRQRVSLPCACVVCGRIGGKQENHELEKLFTPDYDRLKASAHFIRSSPSLSPLSSR